MTKRISPFEEKFNRIENLYRKLINPEPLSKSEIQRIGRRLNEFGEDKLLEAIKKFHKNGWWMNNHSYRCAGWFFKKDKIEKFLTIGTRECYRRTCSTKTNSRYY